MNSPGFPVARGTASMITPPSRWSTPSTFCVAKKRSATNPRKKGAAMAAIGFTVYGHCVRRSIPTCAMYTAMVVYRRAAAFDGLAELVAGAFSSSADASRRMGRELGLDPSRVYGTFAEMAAAEGARPAEERIDFVSIVTPNFTHYAIAAAFLAL